MPKNAGIDYGNGKTNVDHEKGIRYGIIHTNKLSSEVWEEFEPQYSQGCPNCGNELNEGWEDDQGEVRDQLEELNIEKIGEALDQFGFTETKPEDVDRRENGSVFYGLTEILPADSIIDVENAVFCRFCKKDIDAENGEQFADQADCYTYEKNGISAMIDDYGDLWIFCSPIYTYAAFCSPCAPGACHLNSPLPAEHKNNKAYCLPVEWFDEFNPCPYEEIAGIFEA